MMNYRYISIALAIASSIQASAINIPVSQTKGHIERQVAQILGKESINLAQLPTPVSIALNQRINNLFSRIKKLKKDTIAEDKLATMVSKFMVDFAKQTKESVSSKGLEAAVTKVINQAFAEAELSTNSIPSIMKVEFRSKKDYVLASLGKKFAETPTITMSEVSILVHTVFDPFIERIEYFQTVETGKELLAAIDHSAKPKCSRIIIPNSLRNILRTQES